MVCNDWIVGNRQEIEPIGGGPQRRSQLGVTLCIVSPFCRIESEQSRPVDGEREIEGPRLVGPAVVVLRPSETGANGGQTGRSRLCRQHGRSPAI